VKVVAEAQALAKVGLGLRGRCFEVLRPMVACLEVLVGVYPVECEGMLMIDLFISFACPKEMNQRKGRRNRAEGELGTAK